MIADSGSFAGGTALGDLAAVAPSLGGEIPQLMIFANFVPNSAGDLAISMGMASSPTERACFSAFVDDNAATSDSAHQLRTDAVLARLNTTTAEDGRLDLAAVGANSFTPTVDDAFASSPTIIWSALAGMTGAKVTTIQLAAGGNQTFDLGLGGAIPDVLLFLGATPTPGSIQTHARFVLGWYDGTTQRCFGGLSRDARAAVDSFGLLSQTHPWVAFNAATGALSDSFVVTDLVANGFTINRDLGTNTPTIIVAALWGVSAKTLDTVFRTDTSDQPVTGAGFLGEFLLTLSRPVTAFETASSTHLSGCIGLATGATKRFAGWFADEDAQDPSDPHAVQVNNRVAALYDLATGAVVQADMDFKSFDADGWTGDEITAAASNWIITSLLLGDEPAPPAGPGGNGLTGADSITHVTHVT